MQFPVLCMVSSNRDMFVDFWDKLYSGYDEDFYRDNIVQPLTPDRIQCWFKWKNGSTLSAKKAKTILRYLAPEEQVTADTATDQIVAFFEPRWRCHLAHFLAAPSTPGALSHLRSACPSGDGLY